MDETLKKAQTMLEQTKAEGNKSFAGSKYDVPLTITPNSLKPVTPMSIPEQPQSTKSAGLLASLEGINQASQKTAETLAPVSTEMQRTNDTLANRIISRLGMAGKTELTANEYEQTGVNTAQKELNDITNQINQKNLDYRRQIEKLQSNKAGLESPVVQGQISNIERQAASELADLAVIQSAKQNNYATAKDIADRKIAAELEQRQNEIDTLKFVYQENKDSLTKAEDRQFNLMLSERERLLKEEETTKKGISDIALNALQNGAPTSLVQQAQKAKTLEEAIGLVGGYVDAQDRALKQAQISSLYLKQTGTKPATGAEKTALGFYNRAQNAVDNISQIEDKISKLGLAGQLRLQKAPNFLQTSEGKLYNQAQRSFTEARLRKESGAAIPESEIQNDRMTYFAQPGDDPATIAQKKAAREVVLSGLKFQSGNAYEEYYGFPPQLEQSQDSQIITTADGKQWRVLSDGSYEEI